MALLRISGIYDDQRHSIPIAHQIKRIYENQITARVFPGDITRGQSFMHLEDLVEGLVLVVERRRELPPGVISIVLVILQPVSVGAWCALCLVASVVMLLMVPPALDEVIATSQFLLRIRREGGSVWHALWRGEGHAAEEPESPQRRSRLKEILHGIEVFSAPWNLLLSALAGVWLMAAPSVLGLADAAADSTHIAGALAVTLAVIAFAEPARLLRFFNVLCGAWVLLSAWLLSGGTPAWRWIAAAGGLALIVLSFRRGPVEDRYGGWQ